MTDPEILERARQSWIEHTLNSRPLRHLDKYVRLDCEIQQLTGYTIESLRDLFAMGYTLQRPEYEMTLTELAKIIDGEA